MWRVGQQLQEVVPVGQQGSRVVPDMCMQVAYMQVDNMDDSHVAEGGNPWGHAALEIGVVTVGTDQVGVVVPVWHRQLVLVDVDDKNHQMLKGAHPAGDVEQMMVSSSFYRRQSELMSEELIGQLYCLPVAEHVQQTKWRLRENLLWPLPRL